MSNSLTPSYTVLRAVFSYSESVAERRVFASHAAIRILALLPEMVQFPLHLAIAEYQRRANSINRHFQVIHSHAEHAGPGADNRTLIRPAIE